MRKLIFAASTTLVSIAIDQFTKNIATQYLIAREPISFLGDSVRLIYSVNHGAFLGLGSSLPEGLRNFIFSTLVGIFLLGFGIYILRERHSMNNLQMQACALVFSGGISNLYDRITNNGGVVDFMYMGIGWLHTGIFNVADIAIMAGVGLLLFTSGKIGK